jgi:hypothetical protein
MATLGVFGGAGRSKSALSALLAYEWMRRGKRTLLVDNHARNYVRAWSENAAKNTPKLPVVVTFGRTIDREDQLPLLMPGFEMVVIDSDAERDRERAVLNVVDVAIALYNDTTSTSILRRMAMRVDIVRAKRPNIALFVLLMGGDLYAGRRFASEVGVRVLESEISGGPIYEEIIPSGRTDDPGGEIARVIDEIDGRLDRPMRAPSVAGEGSFDFVERITTFVDQVERSFIELIEEDTLPSDARLEKKSESLRAKVRRNLEELRDLCGIEFYQDETICIEDDEDLKEDMFEIDRVVARAEALLARMEERNETTAEAPSLKQIHAELRALRVRLSRRRDLG